MTDAVGSIVCGYRITERLHAGAWDVYRAQGTAGAALVTVTATPPPGLAALGLPFPGIPELVGTAEVGGRAALVEREPRGWTIGELKWPLPIDEVITVGLDLARLLDKLHAAGAIHGALRPQLTWIDNAGGRSSLSGTTPRPELAGEHGLDPARLEASPFQRDPFVPHMLARGEPRSAASDVAQLGMMLHHMAMCASPFARTGDTPLDQHRRAVEGDIPPWKTDDPRARAVEELARDAFDPARTGRRTLAPLLDGLEQLSR
ncbi:MAG: serine/threonine protein kinase [Deltaproteobacteria bacterium]|nr:serine/threonine protein kinase [Deltaproteobacteria bacterium]